MSNIDKSKEFLESEINRGNIHGNILYSVRGNVVVIMDESIIVAYDFEGLNITLFKVFSDCILSFCSSSTELVDTPNKTLKRNISYKAKFRKL